METSGILIIDDDANLRKTLSDILKAKGYELRTAKDGTEGLLFMKQMPADVALIDLKLPDIPGIELLQKIKAEHPSTEVIILTGHASLDSAVEATNRGAFSYLKKPYEIDQLLVHIKRAIEKKQTEEALRVSRETFRLAAECAGDLIFEWDAVNDLITYLNDSLEKLSLRKEELPSNFAEWERIIHPEDHDMVIAEVERHLAGGKPISIEYRIQKADGTSLYVSHHAAAVRNEDNRPYKVVGAMTDITARKHLENDLRNKLDEVERINKLMVGRELKMAEMRMEIQKLKSRISELEKKE